MSQRPLNRRYSKQEFAERGDTIYQKEIRPRLKSTDDGKFAAIDIETSNYEIDDVEIRACDRLRAKLPEAQIWLVRIGSPYVHRFGGRDRQDTR